MFSLFAAAALVSFSLENLPSISEGGNRLALRTSTEASFSSLNNFADSKGVWPALNPNKLDKTPEVTLVGLVIVEPHAKSSSNDTFSSAEKYARKLQKDLASRNCHYYAIDGVFGEKSQSSARKFLKAANLQDMTFSAGSLSSELFELNAHLVSNPSVYCPVFKQKRVPPRKIRREPVRIKFCPYWRGQEQC